MVKGSRAVPATPMKSGGSRSEPSSSAPATPRMAAIAECSVSFEDSADDPDIKEEMVDYDYLEEKAELPLVTPDDPEDATLSATHSGGLRSLSRNLVDELDEIAKLEPAYDDDDKDDDEDEADEDVLPPTMRGQATVKTRGNRPPMNGDTPIANKVLGRCLELMRTESEWMQMFSPKPVRQAIWADLRNALAWSVNPTSTRQVAEQTLSLLTAMGFEAQAYPPEMALKAWSPANASAELQKWKKKLRLAFGAPDPSEGKAPPTRPFGKAVDPSTIPLPPTPKKRAGTSARAGGQQSEGVFAVPTDGSPYFPDTHMVTPRSTSRSSRLAQETEASKPARNGSTRRPGWRLSNSDDSSDDGGDLFDFSGDKDDLAAEFARQIREASESAQSSVTPKLEIATHRPLAQIKPYRGTRDKQENSMQWLRSFVYEMKGTHTPPNEWCMAFELSLLDGALHWFRQLPKKTRRDWQLLNKEFISYYCSQFNESAKTRYYSAQRTDKEHICDYLNRLNGYARNAGVRFSNGGREARDHVRRFLKTCGDKSLQQRLGYLQVNDIHELEGMINEILKMEDCYSSKEPAQSSQRNREPSRGRDNYRRRDDSRDGRDGYRRDRRDRDYERRGDDYRNQPRVNLADATLTDISTELQARESGNTPTEHSKPLQYELNDDDDDYGAESDRYDDERSDGYISEAEERHLAAANETERRAAAEGTYGRSGNRPPRGDRPDYTGNSSGRLPGRDRRDSGRQYGPCVACGGLNHSAHYCYKRCKLCKQVHDAGKCEAFQELANLVKAKVDKKDLSQELQNLVFGHLN